MDIEKGEMLAAAEKLGIPKSSMEALWSTLSKKPSREVSTFDLSSVLYYFGAMIVIFAMGWFANSIWERFGGGGLLVIALTYMAAFVAIGTALWRKWEYKVPGGLFITMAVCMIPLAVYGFQQWTGWWVVEEPGRYKDFFSWVRSGWFVMEVATIVGGCLALKYVRFPFLTAPIFFALWFLSMDITPLLFGDTGNQWDHQMLVSAWFGIGVLVVAYVTDITSREDFAFWGYLFGVVTFWIGVSKLNSASELENFFYLLINIGLILLSVLLKRSVFLVFGSIGVLVYITSLFDRYFSNSAWFPIILSLVGLAVIYIGVTYHKNRAKIDAFILNLIPSRLHHWLPKTRE
jgi:hypothetical protein